MKTLKIFIAFLFAGFAMNAQDLNKADVPNAITSAFETEYSTANDVEWEKSGDQFNVEFEIDRQDHEIWYNAVGDVVKSKREIANSELPSTISNALGSNYSNFRIEDAELWMENGKKTYRIEVEDKNQEKVITFSENGEVVNEVND